MIQHNIGNVLKEKVTRYPGDDSTDCELMIEAAKAFTDALEIRTRDRFPVDWAKTQANLGPVLQSQANRCCGKDNSAKFIAAQEAYHAALEIYTRSNFALEWAMTQNNLAYCFARQAFCSTGDVTTLLDQAINGYRNALHVFSERGFPGFHKVIVGNLQHVQRELALAKQKNASR